MTRKKWIAAGLGLALLAAAGVFYERDFLLPPADPAARTEVGDKAPDFSLASTAGARVTLPELLRRGPLVLVFYRGDW
jgi:hypothetical protein